MRRSGFLSRMVSFGGCWIVPLFLLIMPLNPAAAMPGEFLTDEGIRVRTENLTEDDYRWTRGFLNHVERVVKELPSPRNGAAFPCQIDFAADRGGDDDSARIKLSKRNGAIRILLPSEVSLWKDDRRVRGRLILIAAARRLGRLPTRESRLPDWVLAALMNKLSSRLESGRLPGPKVYPAAHGLLMNGIHPNVWELIKHPPPLEDGPVQDVYAELCELLWNASKRLRGDWWAAMETMLLKTLMDGKASDETLFLNTLGRLIVERNSDDLSDFYFPAESLSGGDAAQWWFLRELRRRAVNLHMPGDVSFARREFARIKAFECLPIVEEEESGDVFVEPVPIKMEDLAEKWEEIGERGALLNRLKRNFVSLKYELPEEFYVAFNHFLKGFEELRDGGDPADFAEAVAAGNEAFELAAVKRQAVEDYLADAERTLVPPGVRRSHSFEVIAAWRRRREKFWPALNHYLDQIEMEYGTPSGGRE